MVTTDEILKKYQKKIESEIQVNDSNSRIRPTLKIICNSSSTCCLKFLNIKDGQIP